MLMFTKEDEKTKNSGILAQCHTVFQPRNSYHVNATLFINAALFTNTRAFLRERRVQACSEFL